MLKEGRWKNPIGEGKLAAWSSVTRAMQGPDQPLFRSLSMADTSFPDVGLA